MEPGGREEGGGRYMRGAVISDQLSVFATEAIAIVVVTERVWRQDSEIRW